MEYRYGTQPNPENHSVLYGLDAIGFEKISNGYFNNAVQITNRNQDTQATGNVRDRSSVQTSQNTFVRLDIDRLEEYLDYDDKLTDVSNLSVEFENNINVYYDTVRYHFISGYNFGTKDGAIVQIQFQERNGKKAKMIKAVLIGALAGAIEGLEGSYNLIYNQAREVAEYAIKENKRELLDLPFQIALTRVPAKNIEISEAAKKLADKFKID
jgi:hypothetical protein